MIRMTQINWDDITEDPHVVLVYGPYHSLTVRDGDLIIKDGNPEPRTYRKIGVPRIRHLIITGTHGTFTSEAKAWLVSIRATWVHIDTSGRRAETIGCNGGIHDPHRLRKQAMLREGFPYHATGLELSRSFRVRKLEGQAWNAEMLLGNETAAKNIRACLDRLLVAPDIASIGGHEGDAAATYWEAWRGMAIPWKGGKPTQSHWLAYPGRKTLIPVIDPDSDTDKTRDSNRGATDPVNAMLNYAYHQAEMECVIALRTHGLSPELGIDHADIRGRDSMALDLIECLRPSVDELILGLVGKRLVRDQYLVSDGRVRLRGQPKQNEHVRDLLPARITAAVHHAARQLRPHIRDITDALGRIG